MAAVDYALENWKGLFANKGIKGLDKLTNGEKAKIMYLLHHEGPGDGPNFIKNTLIVDQDKFDKNVTSKSEWLSKAVNDLTQAYRLCLAHYIDERIVFSRFAYNVNSVEEIIPLLDIFPKITK